MFLTGAVVGCGASSEAITPTVAPSAAPEPTAVPLPDGWVRHEVDRFSIGLPDDWIVLNVDTETIDILIEQMTPTNPEWVPFVERLKNQQAIKLWALDPASPRGFAISFQAAREARLIESADHYVSVMEEQGVAIQLDVDMTEDVEVSGIPAVRLRNRLQGAYQDGGTYQVEQQMAIIDIGSDRFILALSTLETDAPSYRGLFDSIAETFLVAE